MRAHNWIYLNSIVPLVEADRNRGIGKLFQSYQHVEEQSIELVQKRQWDSLSRLLHHAYESTEFYRDRFDTANIHPRDIRTLQDLQQIPPLTRSEIQDHLPRLCSNRFTPERLGESHTGGTTSTPVNFLRNKDSVAQKNAVQWLFNSWAGFLPGDRVLYFWGAQSDFPKDPSWRWRLYDQHLMKRMWAQTSNIDDDILASYRNLIDTFKPRIIYGYPTTLKLLCRFLEKHGPAKHRPVAVICTAESIEHRREIIERNLGAPLYEHYGAREFGMIAGQCEYRKGLHFHPSVAFTDFLSTSAPQGSHEIFVTDLFNYGMPLIRYQTEDFVVLSDKSCPCGRPFHSMAEVAGRRFAMFHLPDGRSIMGVGLAFHLKTLFPEMFKFQIVQHTYSKFELRYVSDIQMLESTAEKIRTLMDEFFAMRLDWTFVRVDDIPREASGKSRPYVSHVSPLLVGALSEV